MNENPEGTPSPLNPTPGTPTPSADVQAPEPTVPIQEQVAPATEPAKKSRKAPAIIITTILLLVAIGSGIAAIIILKPFGGTDAVPAAISKLMSGAPDYVTATGTISATSDETVPNLNATFKASVDNKKHQNHANVKVTADLGMDEDFEFLAEEIHTADGILYLKLSGVLEALDAFNVGGTEVTNCADNSAEPTNCGSQATSPVMGALGLIEVIDDEWVQIPDSAFSSVSGIVTFDSTTQCLIDAADKLGQYGDDFVDLYNKNQFMNYSTDGITIAKKQDPIYKLSFDAEKLASFMNSMGNSGFMNELNACMGDTATNVKVDADSLAEILAEVPEIYVEINEDNDFTRVYLSADKNGTNVTMDVSFSYPNSITIEEPKYYIDFNSLLSQVLGSFFNTNMVDY